PTSGPGSPITQTRFTDSLGTASLGVVPSLAAGVYKVQAFFGGGTTAITLQADPIYQQSQTSGTDQFVVFVDGTAPTIAFNRNQASYGLLDRVHITCTATDAAPSSGLQTNPCTSFLLDAPAWSFDPGANKKPTPGLVATDNAGNSSAPAQASFTVTA